MLHFAPINKPKPQRRNFFLAPNGTYYGLTFPTVMLAEELLGLGVTRIVISADEESPDYAARDLLLDADVEIVFRRAA